LSLLKQNTCPQNPEEVKTIDIWYNFPLKDEGTLQKLEVKLKEDKKYRKKLINIKDEFTL